VDVNEIVGMAAATYITKGPKCPKVTAKTNVSHITFGVMS